MRVVNSAGSVLLRGRRHWERCRFENAALLDDVISLALDDTPEQSLLDPTPFTQLPAGLAFDRRCRLFHTIADTPQLEFLLWLNANPLAGTPVSARPFVVTGAESEAGAVGTGVPLPTSARSLAADGSDYLYVADPEGKRVWLIDPWQQEIARRVELAAPPLDLAAVAGKIFVLLEQAPGWGVLDACSDFKPLPWPEPLSGAKRLDCAGDPEGGGSAFVLLQAGGANAELVSLSDPRVRVAVPYCTDFVIASEDPEFGWLFVAARRPGEDFRRFHFKHKNFHALTGLIAPHYDGRGIALAPDGRIAFWTQFGVGHAAPTRTTYTSALPSRVYGYALDSERDHGTWGVLTLEACIPEGTSIVVHAFTRDDLEYDDPLPRVPPSGETLADIAEAGATPLPSVLAWSHRASDGQLLFRSSSTELLGPKPAPGFAHYDAPVLAAPGRYLWLVFELSGSRHKSPRLRSARVTFPGHDLLRLLPKTLWRDAAAHSFLTRYLTPLARLITSWGETSDTRQRLLDPRVSPTEALDWLAGFVGLAMDPCWPERARRRMIGEAAVLFYGRGTLWSLTRMLEILTEAEVVILERYRLRGGGVVGNAEGTSSRAILGGGFRVGGDIGEGEAVATELVAGGGFDDFAHRFSVMVVAALSEEQLGCARRLVEAHKPAHTLFDLCTAQRGSRVGLGMHVGVAAVIGASSGFEQTVLGDAVLGKGNLLGRPDLDAGGGRANGGGCT